MNKNDWVRPTDVKVDEESQLKSVFCYHILSFKHPLPPKKKKTFLIKKSFLIKKCFFLIYFL